MIYLVHFARVAFFVALICGFACPTLADDKVGKELPFKEVKTGVVPDADPPTPIPAYITNAKDFEALWKAWKIEGNPPEVDFKTELLIVHTTNDYKPLPLLNLDDKGNLSTLYIRSRGFGRSLRYVILSVKKEGVKSVDGSPLKESARAIGVRVQVLHPNPTDSTMICFIRNACATLLAVLVCGFAGPALSQDKSPPKTVTPDRIWNGSVSDLALMKSMPNYITNAKDLDALWKKWKLEGNPPEVDFQTQILIVGASAGGTVQPRLLADGKGDVKPTWVGKRDGLPGFRYALVSIKKVGVTSVNGVALKD